MSLDQIEREAMALPPEQKAKLAEDLLASLEGADRAAIDAAWAEEAERRIDSFEAGTESSRSLTDAIGDMRNRLGQK